MDDNGRAREMLADLGGRHGLSKTVVMEAISDVFAREALKARCERHSSVDHVIGAPTVSIANTRLEGRQTLEVLSSAILEAERAATRSI